jgi:hypothetical protein
MVGVTEEQVDTPLWEAFKKRHVWLQVNLLTAFLAGWVVSMFEGTITQIVVLAAFLPILAGQSVRTSKFGYIPPYSAGTVGVRKPASPMACTRARQASSTSSCGSLCRFSAAQRFNRAAKSRWPSLKKGQVRVSASDI